MQVWGQNLDRLMTEKRVQNDDLAKVTGKDKGTISRWRNGKQGPDLPVLLKVAKILEVPPYLLLLPQHADQVALNALKTARQGAGLAKSQDYARLLEVTVSGLMWALVDKWSMPGSKIGEDGIRALAEASSQISASGLGKGPDKEKHGNE